MNGRDWLNERRLSGMLMLIGSILFFVAAAMPVWDSNGKSVYLMTIPEQLIYIVNNGPIWAWTNGMFIAGTLVAVAGLALFANQLRASGDATLGLLGMLAVTMGAVIWVIDLCFRISVSRWAVGDATNTGAIDLFTRLYGWVETMFIVSTVLMLFGLAAFGASILLTRVVSAWAGWVAVVVGVLGLVILVLTGDLPPFVHYIPVLLLSIAVLRKPSRQSVLAPAPQQGLTGP